MEPTLKKDGGRYTLEFERRLPHPPEKVWRALTEPALLQKWFPADIIGEWSVGSTLEFVMRIGDGQGLDEAELRGEVLAVQPPRLLEYRWGESVLRCELSADGDGCRLIFSESFSDGSIAARNTAGWEWCLANLDAALNLLEPMEFVIAAWRVVFERYQKKFEPLAGPQQGPPEDHPDVVEERAAAQRGKG